MIPKKPAPGLTRGGDRFSEKIMPKKDTAKLAVTALDKRFDALEALRGIELAVAPGEFISLVGPSGCGKTTFLRIVAGLEQATAGRVLIDGRPVTRPGGDRGFVFQND